MFHSDGHLNKHGYFVVGSQNFYSKLDAVKFSVQTDQPVTWYYNNDAFRSLDWTQEPESDIRELYRQRAQCIRDRYDYVVCMFSGGADSTAMIDSFVDNNIPIDEIFVYHWMEGEKNNPDSFMNAEITHSVMPYLERKIKGKTQTFVRIEDKSQMIRQHLLDTELRKKSFREVNNVHNIGIISFHHDLHRRYPEYRELYSQGKRVAFVWGDQKPAIEYDLEKKKHYCIFEDNYPHAPQPRDQEENDPNCNHEHFYNDSEFGEIKIKQCHLLLKTLRQVSHRSDIFFPISEYLPGKPWGIGKLGFSIHHPRGSSAQTIWDDKIYVLDRNAFNCTIYPDWNFLTYHMDKQFNRLLHPAYKWLTEIEPKASKEYILEYIREFSKLPEEWTKYRGGLEQNIKRLTIRYDLE
jgi:hypothetical protein